MSEVLISAALVAAISGVFAVLLLVAERYLVNYGPCSIDVNSGAREIDVDGGDNLLMTLKNGGIFIPSACGGRGTCAYCKVEIAEGGGPVGPTELPLLSEQEAADGVRISCQCKVRNDMKVVIPEELLSVREYRGRVVKLRDLTHDMKELRIELIEPETIRFSAGQYVQLEAPAYRGNPESVFRAYSMSNQPSDDRHVETIIRLVPGGICTTWVFEMLKEGDEVSFTGPFGDFSLSDHGREMIWIAGGSGMAPFWSMLRHMKDEGLARPCTYFYGAVKGRDMFFADEMARMQDELPWFRYVPALSGPQEGDGWSGEVGLITEVVGRQVSDGATGEAYLCGSPGMIDAAIEVLHAKGITDDRIFFDKFA